MPLLLLGPLGGPELIFIAFLIIIIFGYKRLPALGSGLGEGIRNFKSSLLGKDETNTDKTENNSKPS